MSPELPTVPSFGRGYPEAGLCLRGLHLDIIRGADGFVVKEPSDPGGWPGDVRNLESDNLVTAEDDTVIVIFWQLEPGSR